MFGDCFPAEKPFYSKISNSNTDLHIQICFFGSFFFFLCVCVCVCGGGGEVSVL